MRRLVEDSRYEAVMLVLAVLAVGGLVLEPGPGARAFNTGVWIVFTIDYVLRLLMAEDRWRFVRSNVFDLIAILPADVLRLARVARLARLARAGSLVWRTRESAIGILRTNGSGVALLVTVVVVTIGAGAAWRTDPTFETYGDALWWAVVTSTTVGYGDLSPETAVARVVAVMVMLVGIGTVGLLTASIANYFSRDDRGGSAPAAQVVLRDGTTVDLDDDQAAVVEALLRSSHA